jgi:tetratricopeptide (TPR) repeat protein
MKQESRRFERWECQYQQSLAFRHTLGDRVGKADSFYQLGKVYEPSGDKSKARDLYRQSLQLWQAMGKAREEARLLNRLGAIHLDLGEKQLALDYYRQALKASSAAKAQDEEAIALKGIGQLSPEAGVKQKTEPRRQMDERRRAPFYLAWGPSHFSSRFFSIL